MALFRLNSLIELRAASGDERIGPMPVPISGRMYVIYFILVFF